MGLFGGIASAVGGVASTILGNNSAKHEAEKNRDWQEEMSNTSIQRRIADLKSAGLNPLLAVSSASSGASTPSGAQADIKHFDPATITTLMNGLASARLTEKQAEAQEQENSLFEYRKKASMLQNELIEKKILNADVERELKEAQTEAQKVKILTEAYKRAKIDVDISKVSKEVQLLDLKLKDPSNSEIGRAMKMMGDSFSTPGRAVGSILGGLGAGSAKLLQGLFSAVGNLAEKGSQPRQSYGGNKK